MKKTEDISIRCTSAQKKQIVIMAKMWAGGNMSRLILAALLDRPVVKTIGKKRGRPAKKPTARSS